MVAIELQDLPIFVDGGAAQLAQGVGVGAGEVGELDFVGEAEVGLTDVGDAFAADADVGHEVLLGGGGEEELVVGLDGLPADAANGVDEEVVALEEVPGGFATDGVVLAREVFA